MNNDVKYDVQDEPIVIHKATTDRLLKTDKPVDAMAVYWFYYQTAKWQTEKHHVRYTKATNNYVAQGLHITERRVSAASQILVKLGMITRIETRDPNTKRVTGNYIKVHFMWGNSRTGEIAGAGPNSRTGEKPLCGYSRTNTEETIILNTEETKNIPPRGIACFVERFFAIQKKNHPSLVRNVTKSQIKQSIETINQLVRIEHYALSQVFKTILFAVDHPFWTKQVLSPVGLRNRSKNGNIKFVNILANMEEDTPDIGNAMGNPDTATLNLDAQEFYDFVTEMLGSNSINKSQAASQVKLYRDYYDSRPTNPNNVCQGPTIHIPWRRDDIREQYQFFPWWLNFLRGQCERDYRFRSLNDLAIGGKRWNEYIHKCEYYACHSFETGKHIDHN